MEDVAEDMGYDVTLPMVDHTLSSATVAGHAAIKLHRDIEQLLMVESTMETARACIETQRLLFIFVSIQKACMNVELVLAADTLHHRPLNEHIMETLLNVELRENVVAGQWVSSYKLCVTLHSDDNDPNTCCEEGTVGLQCEKIDIDLSTILSSINCAKFQQKSVTTKEPTNDDLKKNIKQSWLSINLHLTMKNQEYGNSVYKQSVRMDPSMLNCFNQLTSLITSSAHYRAGDGYGIKEFLFVDPHIYSKENILSTISTHLRTGFRSCPLSDELDLPIKPTNEYKSYKNCQRIYQILESRGLLKSCITENNDNPMTLSISIPSGTLISQIEANNFNQEKGPDKQMDTNTGMKTGLSIQASCIPVVLPCMPTISQYLDKLDPSGQWKDMRPDKIRNQLLQKQSLLQSAQQRLKQAEILEQVASSGGFERALRRLTDSSDLLGGMQYLMRPGAEHRPDETHDLETLSQQVIQTAGPEFVRSSVSSALLGRYKQDSLL